MDYGKLAYMQLEDLKRQINSFSVPKSDKKIISTDEFAEKIVFTGSYISPKLSFVYTKGGLVEVFVSFSLNSTREFMSSIVLYAGNVEIETKKFTALAGNNFYTLSFIVDYLAEGDVNLKFIISAAPDSQSAISSLVIRIQGTSISEKKTKTKVNVIEKGYLDKALFGDGNLVIMYFILDGKFENSIEYKEYGDYSLSAYLFKNSSGEENHDLLFFSIKHKKLFMTVIPVFSEYVSYTVLVAEGVSSVDSVCVEPHGAVVAFIKGNKVCIAPIVRDSQGYYLFGEVVSETLFFPMPSTVRAATNMSESFAFLVSDVAKKNHILLAPKQIEHSGFDVINSQISFSYVNRE